MEVHCNECEWRGPDTALLSGEDDGYGPRGVCPNCGADEEEFEYFEVPNPTAKRRCEATSA